MPNPEIARRCPECGASNKGRAPFCPQCGHSFQPAPSGATGPGTSNQEPATPTQHQHDPPVSVKKQVETTKRKADTNLQDAVTFKREAVQEDSAGQAEKQRRVTSIVLDDVTHDSNLRFVVVVAILFVLFLLLLLLSKWLR